MTEKCSDGSTMQVFEDGTSVDSSDGTTERSATGFLRGNYAADFKGPACSYTVSIMAFRRVEQCGVSTYFSDQLFAYGFLAWALHWVCWNLGCQKDANNRRWQDDCNHVKLAWWRANRHAIPTCSQFIMFSVGACMQFIFGITLLHSCGRHDGWGIAHTVMGSLTLIWLPKMIFIKVRTDSCHLQHLCVTLCW